MDKFGIFNLLNSFLGLDKGADNSSPPAGEPLNNRQDLSDTEKKNGFSPANNPSGAVPSGGDKTKQKNPSPAAPPLRGALLSAMRSHDEFIKRVQKNNSPPQK